MPAPVVLSTDCGWFRLATDGEVTRLPSDWLVTHKQPMVPPRYTIRRTRPGRYIVLREGRVVWRSRGLYFNEDGSGVFGPRSFAFNSYGRRGVFLTDLRGPERLVVRGRSLYPVGFARNGELLVAGRGTILVISHDGTVVRRLRYRRANEYVFDESPGTLYFVTPRGVLSAADGSKVRPIARLRVRGWLQLLGRRLLVVSGTRQLTVLRRDGSFVASARWRESRRMIDAVDVSDDGKLFAFRLWNGEQGARAAVYVLRAGERRAREVYRHRITFVGCGYSAGVDWSGSSFLYRSATRGIAELALLGADGSKTRLTPLLRALPRKSRATPGNAFWEADFPR